MPPANCVERPEPGIPRRDIDPSNVLIQQLRDIDLRTSENVNSAYGIIELVRSIASLKDDKMMRHETSTINE